jgi:hypothetical protein
MILMRRLLLFCLFAQASFAHAQTTEDFNDGDFGDGNPLTWIASQISEGNDFVITSGELQSNGPAATASIFITTNTGIDFASNDVVWSFKARYAGGAPSSSNFIEIYLMSDVADVSGSPQGYYIKLGESGSADGIDLFSTSSGTAIIADAGDQVAAEINAHIRVTRTGNGNWTLEADATGGDTFTTIGTVTDTNFSSGDFFGFFVKHSSTKKQDFFFDDVTITLTPIPDTTPPTIQSITAISSTEVDVLFSENVDQTTAELSTNYALSGGATVSNAVRDGSNSALVHLTTSSLTNGETYIVTINNVEDESANAIVSDSQESFEYLVIEEAEAGDVVVNEFYASPNSESTIPNVEFIELLNISEKFIQLENWTFSDATGTSSAFTSFRLDPDEYVILTNVGNGTLFNSYGDVLEVANFRSLNNGGDDIIVTNSLATDIYTITYTTSTSGISTELINPNGPDYSLNNYGLSTDADGGTPGSINSIFDDTPDTTPPAIVSIEVISSTELDVTFDEPVQESAANVLGNYSIDGGITITTTERDNDDNLLVHLTVSELVSGDTRTLTINNVTDISGNAIAANSTMDFEYILTEVAEVGDVVINEFYASPNSERTIPSVEFVELFNRSEKFIDLASWTFSDQSSTSSSFGSFIIRPDSFVILTETDNGVLFDSFGDWLEVGNFPALNNGGDSIIISNASSLIIHEIKYTTSTSGVSTELINPNGPDYTSNNYGLSTELAGGTPGSINSIFDDTPDTTPPTISNIEVVSQTELQVTFNEPLDEPSSETISNYAIDGGATVTSATRNDEDLSIVQLVVSSLVSGEVRTLSVTGVSDLSGNLTSAEEFDFRYINIEEAIAGDVVINEFYPIPDGESLIPNAEFIELFNLSEKFIEMKNWTFSDLTGTSSTFPSFVLEPGAFLILTNSGNASSFNSYGDAIDVGNFRSLNNGGDAIAITNANAVEIHSTSYSNATSGITIELINPNGPDYSENNYDLSTDPNGGTPGAVNSIFDDTPDTTPPTIVSISVVSSTELEVVFDEPLDETSAETSANYTIDGGITVSLPQRSDSDNSIIQLIVSQLTSAQEQTLTINNVTDLSGNAIAANSTMQFEYIETEEAAVGDIVINEFYATPNSGSAIPAVEFVELFNRSSKYIDLVGWTFSDNSSSSSPLTSYIIRPGEYVILAETDNGDLFGNASLEVGNFPALNNGGDSIIIKNVSSIVIHEIGYTNSTSGITTELINPNGPDYSSRNYGLSTDPIGGTPGTINSIFDDTPDTTPPTIVSITVVSSTELEVVFNEPVEEVSAETIANYSINGGITIFSSHLYDTANNVVQLVVSQLISAQEQTLTINNITDLSGNAIATNSTIQFEYIETEEATEGDIVINEFYATPNSGSTIPAVEFVELFNRSSKYIDLVGWTFSDNSSSSSPFTSYIIRPGEYVILTETDNGDLFDSDSLEVGNFPALNNGGDSIIIKNASSIVIHEIGYTNSTSGITTELINPNGPDYSSRNYGLSTDPIGGTPGTINSIFDDTPDTTPPTIVSITVVSSTELEVVFNEPVEEVSAETIANYSIDGGITIFSSLLYDTANNVVQLEVSSLTSAEVRTLTINNVTDLSGNAIAANSTIQFEYIETEEAVEGDIVINEFYATPNSGSAIPAVEFVELFNRSAKYIDLVGWTFSDNSSSSSPISSYILRPGGYVILTETDNGDLFNSDSLEVENFPALNNGGDSIIIKNAGSIIIHEIGYTNSTTGITTELINPNGPDYSSRNYGLSTDPNGGTPGAVNSIFDDTPDTTPPTIVSISVVSSTELEVVFDEPLEEVSAETITNYSIDGGVTVSSAQRSDSDNSIIQLIVSSLTSAEVRTFTINNVTDLSGNAIASTVQFEYIETEEAVAGDIVVNEFYATPNSGSVIPAVEFVELFNRSAKYIDLAGWTFSDNSSSSSPFTSFIIRPGEYVILTETDNGDLFSSDSLEVGNFPALNNGGDSIIIKNASAIVIHEIGYTNSTSGITTELINPNGPDYSSRNYGLSTDPNGGTPGTINSIFDDTTDTTPPTIVSITVVSSTELEVVFDEPLEEVSAETITNYSIDGGISVNGAERNDADNSIIHMTVSELTSAEVKTLTINNVTDLSGNTIAINSTIQFEYIETEEAVAGDIVINEFYATPNAGSAIPAVEFVELFNRSSKYIDLVGWTFSDNSSSSIPFTSYIIRPGEYVILTETDNGDLFDSDSLEVENFPALNNGGDSIIIKNASSIVIHEIGYTNSTSGIATELIKPNGPDYSSRNYGLSTDLKGGTPGTINSIFDDTPDTTPPTIVSITVVSSTELEVVFNEPVEEVSAETIANYSINGGITIFSSHLYDTANNVVQLVVSQLISAQEQTLTINNITDLSGNAIATNSTIQFEYIETEEATEGDIVINEFYATPNSGSTIPAVEFVELFNRSSKYIDLVGWTFSDNSSSSSPFTSYIIRPGEYVILTETDNGDLFDSDSLEVGNFPALNNGGDSIIIKNASSIVIHEIGYTNSTSGITTELINPNGPDYSSRNYGLSTDPIGGTPGTINSIFDDTPDTTPPTIVSITVVSSTELEVVFNEPVEEVSAETIANYSIDGGITIFSSLLYDTANNVVQLEVSSLTSAEVRTLTINNVTDLSGNAIAANSIIEFEYLKTEMAEIGDVLINEFLADPIDNNDDFIELWNVSNKYINLQDWKVKDNAATSVGLSSFILRPNEFVIIYDQDATIDFPSFGKSIAIPSLTLNNTNDQIEILDSDDVSIAFLMYADQPDEGISSELINPNDPCITELSYAASTASLGSTPGNQNSIFDETPDTTSPAISSYNFDEVLTIYFSETMNVQSLQNGTYTITDLTINSINVQGAFPNSVDVSFNENLTLGTRYELAVSNVEDCWGNALELTSLSFGIGRKPLFNEVLITEIMADPDPAFVLPDREYIELFNATEDILTLDGMIISDAASSANLPAISLNPFSYTTLSTTTGASEFSNGAIGVSGFTSLSNSGEQLVLSLNEKLIFSVTYDVDWHSNIENMAGGVSLEMIDVTNPCAEQNNWTSSIAFNRGTPSLPNSVAGSVPDNFPPEIIHVMALSADSIRIDFNKKIDPLSATLTNISISPSIEIVSKNFSYLSPKSLFVLVNKTLEESTLYQLTLSNAVDCSGNASGDKTAEFALPSTPIIGQVLLSEILFNPYTNGVDFVELYNNSNQYLDLKNWQIATLSDEGVANEKAISLTQLVLPPNAFIALTSNSTTLLNNYPKGKRENFHEMISLPTFANKEGDVVLLDQEGEVAELFHFNDDFHYSLLKSTDGVSLERISYQAPNDKNNWRSASSTVGFATPGYENSQAFTLKMPKGTVDVEPKVFLPGNSGTGRDFTTISYQLEVSGQFANVNVYDQSGRLTKTLAEGALLSSTGFFRWDGTTNSGNLARLGYYVVLFEVYDSMGNTEMIKETVVVGRDF